MKRTAQAKWQGTGKEGSGTLNAPSGVLNATPYSYMTRFVSEDGKAGTNPEELVAAAHAGCFSMKLAFLLVGAGFTAETIETSCTIVLENGAITESQLEVKASVPGIGGDQFDELIKNAEENCPISKLLNAKISLNYELQ